MTELPERAFARVRALPPETQDDVDCVLMNLADEAADPVALAPEEWAAIVRSKAAAERGEFATDEEVQAVWARCALREPDRPFPTISSS